MTDTDAGGAYRLRWPALFVLLAAEVMDLLDALVTSIAGPTIVRDLGGGTTLIQWLAAGYTIAMASGLLIGGRLGDIHGRARVFRVGMIGFTVSSLACALAVDPAMLIAFRVVQGLFGALMLPQGLGLIRQMFPAGEMGKAFGLFGPIMGLSAVGGPILAGWLVDADLFRWSWRAIFAINVPLGLAALVAGLAVLPASRRDRELRIDATSVAMATTAMVCLVHPLIQGRELGWPWWTFALVAVGLALFALLGRLERVRDAAGRPTLVTPSLLTKRAFTAGLGTGMAFFGALMGMSLVFTLFVQMGLGYSPLRAGIAGIPQAAGMIVGFGLSQPLMARAGGRATMFLGEGCAALGLAGFALTIARAGDGLGILGMAPALVVVGLGMGLTMSPFFDIVLAGVEEHETGSASGILTAVQQLAGALGVAVLGTLFAHLLGSAGGATRIAVFRAATWPCMLGSAGFLVVAAALTTLLPARARDRALD